MLTNATELATSLVVLDRRTGKRTIGAEHAAIAGERLQSLSAALAVIEELAGIGRHRLDGLVAAFGASECGSKLHIDSGLALSIPRLAAGVRRSVKAPDFKLSEAIARWSIARSLGSSALGLSLNILAALFATNDAERRSISAQR